MLGLPMRIIKSIDFMNAIDKAYCNLGPGPGWRLDSGALHMLHAVPTGEAV